MFYAEDLKKHALLLWLISWEVTLLLLYTVFTYKQPILILIYIQVVVKQRNRLILFREAKLFAIHDIS